MSWLIIFLLTVGCAIALPNHKLNPIWKAERHFEVDKYKKIHDENEDVPDFFDAREAWPECADIIGLIRDESTCGGGWAFSAVEVMSDRICILSNATRKLLVSAEALIACSDPSGYYGCSGGWPDMAFSYWEQEGIVTGGLYNHTEQGCQSYSLPPCDDHLHNCTTFSDTPACTNVCDDQSLNYNDHKTYGKNSTYITGETEIQLEIEKNGPVVITMTMYTDLADYTGGIYNNTSEEGDFVGLHAIKIIGWGVENDVKYWLAANSWNERWGEKGYIKITKALNPKALENTVFTSLPDFSRF